MALFNFTEETPKAGLQGEVLATFDKRFELKLDQLAAEGKHIELKLTVGRADGLPGRLADGLVRGSIVGAEGARDSLPILSRPAS